MKPMLFAALTAVTLGVGSPGFSQTLLDSYVAVIGEADLYNSQGKRLTEPWQILRQDRANVHRFGIWQEGDYNDSFFANKDNRALMERIVMDGYIDPIAARGIVRGNVTVVVKIFESSSGVPSVDVRVYR